MAGEKPLLVIPSEFIEQILKVITNVSAEGTEQLVQILENAKNRYLKLFYVFSRTRGEAIDSSIDIIRQQNELYKRLEEFKKLISNGKWEATSYNVYLLHELVKVVPGYQALKRTEVHDYVLKLKELIFESIDFKMKRMEYEALQEKRLQQRISNTLIFTTAGAAENQAQKQKDKIIFSLAESNNKWKLSWHGITGKSFALDLKEELSFQLKDLTPSALDKLGAKQKNLIILECLKAKDALFATVRLIVNPENERTHEAMNNKALIAKGVHPAFILRHDKESSSLYWISSLGEEKEISLASYSKLKSWLEERREQIDEEGEAQLKEYLFAVNTKQGLDKKRINGLEDLFAQKLNAPDKKKTAELSQLPAQEQGLALQPEIKKMKKGPIHEELERFFRPRISEKQKPAPVTKNSSGVTKLSQEAHIELSMFANKEKEHLNQTLVLLDGAVNSI